MATYASLLQQTTGLVHGERNWVANCANVASLLYTELNEDMKDKAVNWAGFYVVDTHAPDQLILGPFMGRPACLRIKKGKGVCGTAWEKAETQRIADVHQFPGHIACDAASNSELVVPLVHEGRVVGVLDMDSTQYACFTEEDQAGIEAIANALVTACDWPMA